MHGRGPRRRTGPGARGGRAGGVAGVHRRQEGEMVFGEVGEARELLAVIIMIVIGLALIIWIQRATSRHD